MGVWNPDRQDWYHDRDAHGFSLNELLRLKLVIGEGLLDTPEQGTLEFANGRFYITDVLKQRAIDRTSDVITSTKTVDNTTTETEIYNAELGAGLLETGNLIKTITSGTITNASTSDEVTFKYKIGGTQVASITNPASNLSGDHWDIKAHMTARSVGDSGEIYYHIDLHAGENTNHDMSAITLDTSVVEDLVITAQWNNAKTGNILKREQGCLELKN